MKNPTNHIPLRILDCSRLTQLSIHIVIIEIIGIERARESRCEMKGTRESDAATNKIRRHSIEVGKAVG